ncbi:hypothetical protein [Candidatus Tisiphia endosymbiont of Mystacides longicornis]|uniref:hypothetical protein n=1 Tax=Candidatus Tisiphia endosymbiont of Mystacides longicornis TaxID=3139330 RepID=UPI003CCB08BC
MQPANPINERYPELVEMLLSGDIRTFQQRFQSFVNQIPDNKRSVNKDGFFPLFNLASFLALPDTTLGIKLGVKKVFCHIEKVGSTTKGVKLAVLVRKPQDRVSTQEQDKLIFIECFDTDSTVQTHFKYNVPQRFTQSEINYLSNQIANYTELNKKGYSVAIRHAKDPVIKSTKMWIETSQFTGNLAPDSGISCDHFSIKEHEKNIENWVSELSSTDKKEVKDNATEILKYFGQEVHKHLVQNLRIKFTKEYEYHGLLTGFFVMLFKYSHNLKCYTELSLGEGFADVVILVRGYERSLNTIPVIVELKKGRTSDISQNDKEQAKKYADAFWYGSQRMITNSEDIVYSVFNCDLEENKRLWIQADTKNVNHQPFSRLVLQTTDRARINEQLKYIYYSIPNEVPDYYFYTVKMLLGQLISTTPREESWEKHVFKYGQEVRGESRTGGTEDVSKNTATFGFINPDIEQKMLVLLNITRSNVKYPIPEGKKVSIESIIGGNSNIKITEVNLKLKNFTKGDKKKFEDWCSDQGIDINSYNSLGEYNNKKTQGFLGQFSEVLDIDTEALNLVLSEAVTVMRKDTIEADDAQYYVKLFKEIAKYLFEFKNLINSEDDFQAVVQGVFSHYSDAQFQGGERISVVPEMQSGGGYRVDIGLVGKKVFVGIELKWDDTKGVPQTNKHQVSGTEITAKANDAEKQLARYKEQPNNIKSLTDGDKAAMLWAVFHRNAETEDKLIEVRSEFDTFPVVHSSMHVMQQLMGEHNIDE